MHRERESRGFSLIELMVVVSVIAIVVAIAIPNLLAARLNANETAAISTLRNMVSAQAQFQQTARADLDLDAAGEYGMFRELSAASPVRTTVLGGTSGGYVLNPAVLSGAFRNMSPSGEVSRSGYLLRIFLPGVGGGVGVGESAGTGGFTSVLDIDLCETTWCAYAWPASYGNSGNRTFFVTQGGDVSSTEATTYAAPGAFNASNCGRAFRPGGAINAITGVQAVGTVARDGNLWKQVN